MLTSVYEHFPVGERLEPTLFRCLITAQLSITFTNTLTDWWVSCRCRLWGDLHHLQYFIPLTFWIQHAPHMTSYLHVQQNPFTLNFNDWKCSILMQTNMLVAVGLNDTHVLFVGLLVLLDLNSLNWTWLEQVNGPPSSACGLPWCLCTSTTCSRRWPSASVSPAAPAWCCSHFVQLQWTMQRGGLDHIPQRRDGQTGHSRALQPHFLRPAGPFGFL